MTPGCRHDNVKPDNPAIDPTTGVCQDCAVIVDMEVWRRLHPMAAVSTPEVQQ